MNKPGRTDSVGLGGTANLAVLGGNLPPSQAWRESEPFSVPVRRRVGGLVARQNGPVARSTQDLSELFGLNRSDSIGFEERARLARTGRRLADQRSAQNGSRFGSAFAPRKPSARFVFSVGCAGFRPPGCGLAKKAFEFCGAACAGLKFLRGKSFAAVTILIAPLNTYSARRRSQRPEAARSPLFAESLSLGRRVLALMACCAAALLATSALKAQIFTTIHSFTAFSDDISTGCHANSDGASPTCLVSSGNTLYGYTGIGGTFGQGTVFALYTGSTGFSTLYNFAGGNDGANPTLLILASDSLYGTTHNGGDSDTGTVFKFKTNGSGFTTLYSFTATSGDPDYINSDGAYPNGLTLSGNTLYGTTIRGGNGVGAVFSINTDGTGFTPLYSFGALSSGPPYLNNDGAFPGGLVLSGGTLYGIAHGGGASGNGNVFKVNTDGTGFKILHSFTALDSNAHNADGAFPSAGLILSGNTLYGAADYGGSSGSGTVFKLNTDGTGFRTVHSFSTGVIVTVPGGLVLSGDVLYGTTYGGVSANGSVFSVKTDGTGFTTLHSFTATAFSNTNGCGSNIYTNSDGASPGAPFLILSSNTLYGTCIVGGGSGNGTVFGLALPRPQLTIAASGANVILTWPTNAVGFTLQSAPALNASFTNIPGATSPYTNAITGAQQYFRLASP